MNTDDTIREGKQAREDVLMSMMESGLLPGFIHTSMESEDDVGAMYELIVREKPPLVGYRVPRDLVKHGAVGGLISAATILGMPEEARGKVMLAFDGWADDDRELFQIPIVVEFCRGMLLASEAKPQLDHSKKLLRMMLNEHEHAFVGGNMVHPQWLDAAGGIWLCGTAFPKDVYYRSRKGVNGWMRQYSTAVEIRTWLLGQGPPPRSGG
jgi:hypothetical protein